MLLAVTIELLIQSISSYMCQINEYMKANINDLSLLVFYSLQVLYLYWKDRRTEPLFLVNSQSFVQTFKKYKPPLTETSTKVSCTMYINRTKTVIELNDIVERLFILDTKLSGDDFKKFMSQTMCCDFWWNLYYVQKCKWLQGHFTLTKHVTAICILASLSWTQCSYH